MTLLDRITTNPDICHGAPTVRGLRYSVEMIVGLLASGMTTDDVLKDYSDLEHDDVLAALEYAALATRNRSARPPSASATSLARVTAVEHLGARALSVTFSDGLVRELDFADALPGVLASIDDDESFAAVTVDRVAGTVALPNGIVLDPDVLHGDHKASAATQPRLLREHRRQRNG